MTITKSKFQYLSLYPVIPAKIMFFNYNVFLYFFRLLIGAPRARALGKQKANITGGLYKCEISQSNDCERIDFDNEGEKSMADISLIISLVLKYY